MSSDFHNGAVTEKLNGFDYWRKTLNSAKYVVAPMVDQSELPWRLLSRKYGAELCFTPMLHATIFCNDATYRKENLATCPEDRPLIAQFCANDPDTLVKACEILPFKDFDGIDLNLGCPQVIARRGNYGAFLQDDWEKIESLIRAVHENIPLPISVKIRVFEDIDKTVRYAQMIERAGCQLLTVHGRTREQKGSKTGLASWEHIAAVKKAVKIPVFANGNQQVFSDLEKCLRITGADGVMTAEGNLHNPALFHDKHLPTWQLALEYLDLVDRYPCALSAVRGHLFKLFHHTLPLFPELREQLGRSSSLGDFRPVVLALRDKLMETHLQYLADPDRTQDFGGLLYPHWISQPYYRPLSDTPVQEDPEVKEQRDLHRKRHHEELEAKKEETGMSKRRLKKLSRNPDKNFQPRQVYDICPCGNPQGTRCEYARCRKCCKTKSMAEELNCSGHKFWFGNIAARPDGKIRTTVAAAGAS